jgi:hypothetical protein
MTEVYDATAKKVNDKIPKLGDTGTFVELAKIDTKLRLPRGTSWEIRGYADYFAFIDEV